jgi:RHS repeat-associated protein
LGSVTSLTTSVGVLGNTYTYDSFGKLTASTGAIVNRFEYTGRELDPETGLYFYRARYYDSTAGRFISEDPHKEVLRGLNFYAYVRNNPVGFTDPDGKSPWDCWDKLWGWLGFGRETWNAAASTMDWSLCGLYYVDCLTQAAGIKKDIAQALNSSDPVVYATALATLAQQTGSNSHVPTARQLVHAQRELRKGPPMRAKRPDESTPIPRQLVMWPAGKRKDIGRNKLRATGCQREFRTC